MRRMRIKGMRRRAGDGPGAAPRAHNLFDDPAGGWLLGAALLQVWFTQVMVFVVAAPAPASELFYAARGVVGLATAALVALAGWRRPTCAFAATWPVAAVMTAAGLVLALGVCPVGEARGLAALTVCGAGLTWCCLQYAHLFSGLEERQGMRCVLAWYALAALAGVPIAFFPAVSTVVVVAFPLLATVCAAVARRRRAAAGQEGAANAPAVRIAGGAGADGRGLSVLVAELAVFGVAVGLLRTFSLGIKDTALSSLVSSLLVLVLCGVLLLTYGRMRRRAGISVVYEAAFLVLMTTIVLVFLGQGTVPALGVVSSWVMRVGLIVLLWLVLVAFAHQSAAHPFVTFGVGWGAYMLAIAGGIALGGSLDVLNQDAPFFLCLAYLLAVSIVAAVGVIRRREERYFAPAARGEREPFPETPSPEADPIDAACERVGAARGLSAREVEVMRMICKGRSKRYIAEQLMVSENTVKFHARLVYQKLDVHSRQELMSLVGVE